MHRRSRRILLGLALIPLLAAGALAVALRRDARCPPPPQPAAGQATMLAVRAHCYGSSAVLSVEPVARPEPAVGQLLVRVHAAGVNPLDWHYSRGRPFIMRLSSGIGRPTNALVGVDFAGVVEAVGRDVTGYVPGDSVFGGATGAFAEYLVVREDRAVARLPAGTTFEEAAGVAIAATTALQAVRDAGRVGPGTRVLVNGASGGVGTYAVQIARALGAHVTGVSSARNAELVLSLGADHVIDYGREDFTRGEARYDVIVDNVGNHSLRAFRRVLEPDGRLVMVTGPKRDPWLGPVSRMVWARVTSPFVRQAQVSVLAELDAEDLEVLRGMMEAGSLRTVLDRRFPLDEVGAALDYLEQGRTRGKNVIVVAPSAPDAR